MSSWSVGAGFCILRLLVHLSDSTSSSRIGHPTLVLQPDSESVIDLAKGTVHGKATCVATKP